MRQVEAEHMQLHPYAADEPSPAWTNATGAID
jgi:hypothetical protein